ncbi:hypothetical protein [Streptomyces sp. NPDC057686]|uniref:hypothetical protein n=1 Tax=Streptomyces sp. NPDC057686 TaxID=3346212 RepID=UPI0036B3D1AB
MAAEAQLPRTLVLDGEPVLWDVEAGRLSSETLQRRATARARGAVGMVARRPAYYVASDVLQLDGWSRCPVRTGSTAPAGAWLADYGLSAPWTLGPMTTDMAKAREWLESRTDMSGVVGTAVKGMNQPYRPSVRGWSVDCTVPPLGSIRRGLVSRTAEC